MFCYVSASEIYVGFEVLRTAIGYSRIRSHWGLRDDFEIYARGTRVLSATLEKKFYHPQGTTYEKAE